KGIAKSVLALHQPTPRHAVAGDHVIDDCTSGPADRQVPLDGLVKEQIVGPSGEAHTLLETEPGSSQEWCRDHDIVRRRPVERSAVGVLLALEGSALHEPRGRVRRIDRLDGAVDTIRTSGLLDGKKRVEPGFARELVVIDEADEVCVNRYSVEGGIA